MRLRRHVPPSIPLPPRAKPKGMDEADWIDVLSNTPIDDELASMYDSSLEPANRRDMRDRDLQDYIDRRGLDLDLE